MSGNTFGKNFKVTTFGESHGAGVGCVIEGVPAGLDFNADLIQAALDRRRPVAASPASTTRIELDKVEILSGVFDGKTEGTPIALFIRNTNQNSAAYDALKDVFRPGHADFTYDAKYGDSRDYRGGGRSSGRETAGRVAAGALAQEQLKKRGVTIRAYTTRAAGISIQKKDFAEIEKNAMRAPDAQAAEKMLAAVEHLKNTGDSAGGIVECVIDGLWAGVGEPVFDKLDALLARAMLSIGAIKGIEFGDGFAAADFRGSQNNDQMHVNENGKPAFDTNHCGGILGGLSTGEQIVFRVAVKPVPSIKLQQKTVRKGAPADVNNAPDNLTNAPDNAQKEGNFSKTNSSYYEDFNLEITGRHDVCLCPRIVPVIEAMTALVLYDLILGTENE